MINQKPRTYTVILTNSDYNGKLQWFAYQEPPEIRKGEFSYKVAAKNKSAAIIRAYGEYVRIHGEQKEVHTALNRALRR